MQPCARVDMQLQSSSSILVTPPTPPLPCRCRVSLLATTQLSWTLLSVCWSSCSLLATSLRPTATCACPTISTALTAALARLPESQPWIHSTSTKLVQRRGRWITGEALLAAGYGE